MIANKPALIVASLILALGLSACDKPGPAEKAGKKIDQVATDTGKKVSQTVDTVEKSMSDQGAKTSQALDDTEITTKVKGAILTEPGLKSLQIGVDTIKGVVMLTGNVDTKANSDKAKAVAAAVNGVKEVNNQLLVTPSK